MPPHRPLVALPCLLLPGCALDSQSLTLPLLGVFALLGLVFAGFLLAALRRGARREPGARIWRPGWRQLLVGATTDFGDTLGIGSFATTTALFRFWKLVPDERIPGTLTVGHTLPTIVQALIFIQLVPVDPATLLSLIAAAGLGAWLGTGLVTRLPRRQIRLGMGTALVVAAAIMLAKQLELLPAGEDALGLTGLKLGIAIAANFALGLIMPLGIGLYAPCMIVVSLLGMNPLAAFPIMMGSCAFLMPLSGARFCLSDAFEPRAAWGIVLAGVPAVLVAAFVVKSLPLDTVRWIVLAVVSYVAWGLLRAGWKEKQEPKPDAEPICRSW